MDGAESLVGRPGDGTGGETKARREAPPREQKYLFLHIPKTAGLSLVEIFRRTLGADNVYHRPWCPCRLPLPTLEQYKLVGGHFTLSAASPLLESRKTIVFLREPIDRVVSSYYYARETNDAMTAAHDPNLALAKRLSLPDFIRARSREEIWSCGNWQTWTMWDCVPASATAESMLARAKENLERCAFVGLTEEFAESVEMLCGEFGWPIVDNMPFVNRTARRPRLDEIDAQTRDLIRQHNLLDVALYEHARGLFERKRRQSRQRAGMAGRGLPGGPAKEAAAAAGNAAGTQASPPQPSKFGSKEIRVEYVEMVSTRGCVAAMQSGEEVVIRIHIESKIDFDGLTVGLRVADEGGNVVYGTNSSLLNNCLSVRAGRRYTAAFALKLPLPLGGYFLTVALHQGLSSLYRCFDWLDDCCHFQVIPDPAAQRFLGLTAAPLESDAVEKTADQAPPES